MLLAPFGRVHGAGRIWQLSPGTSEAKRHAFAIRTCTGCHSQEGVAEGFHIFPRLAGEESKLSPFLTGEPGKNTFTYNGHTYVYQMLEARKKWLIEALQGTAELGDSLKRHETRGHF